jgi:hypothetical protein
MARCAEKLQEFARVEVAQVCNNVCEWRPLRCGRKGAHVGRGSVQTGVSIHCMWMSDKTVLGPISKNKRFKLCVLEIHKIIQAQF